MFSPDADIFFQEPQNYRNPPGAYGVLYLLRRDIFQCMGIDPTTKQPIPHSTLWPGAMAILAGIDLLAKYYAGSDEMGKVGERFRSFLDVYFKPIPADDLATIYQLRNSLLHSFGLYSENTYKGITTKYHFILGQNLSQFISAQPSDVYVVDIRELHKRFESAVLLYKNDIERDTILQRNFTKLFPKYGAIIIG